MLRAFYNHPALLTPVRNRAVPCRIDFFKVVMTPARFFETLRAMAVAEFFPIESQMALAAAHRALARLQ